MPSFFLRDFYELKLPQASRIVGNSESAITDNEHENAQLEVKELAFLDPPNQSPKHRPLLENVIKDDKTVHYGNEAGVTALVLLYLEAVIKAGGLGKKIETFVDLYIAKYRPDVVVIYNERRIPCGVVEVKLPDSPSPGSSAAEVTTTPANASTSSSSVPPAASSSSSRTLRSRDKKPAELALPPTDQQQDPKESGPLASERFKGQIFNYLHFLKTFYKVENPFGIMTTYDEWRVCWLKTQTHVKNRKFEGTEIMSYNHHRHKLHKSIMTALVHMSQPHILTAPDQVGSYFPYLDAIGLTWKQLEKTPDDQSFPASNSKEFMLLAQAGSGIEGKAWVACNSSWKLCLLKTFTTKKDPSSITQVHETVAKEVDIWKKVFGVEEVFSVTLAGAPAIVMPQLRLVQAPGTTTLSLQQGDEEAVREAIKTYAKKGRKVARDLKWSHVGFLEKTHKKGKSATKKAILFATRPMDCDDLEAAEEEMLDKLGL